MAPRASCLCVLAAALALLQVSAPVSPCPPQKPQVPLQALIFFLWTLPVFQFRQPLLSDSCELMTPEITIWGGVLTMRTLLLSAPPFLSILSSFGDDS